MNVAIRGKALIYLILAMMGVLVLAASLPNLRFQPGAPIPRPEEMASSGTSFAQTTSNAAKNEFQPILQGVLVLGIALTLIGLAVSLALKTTKKRITALFVGLVILVLLYILLSLIKMAPATAPIGDSISVEPPGSPIYEFSPIGDPPTAIFKFVTAALLLGIGILGAWLFYRMLHRPHPVDPIAVEAATALKAIEDGGDLKDVILRCYFQMAAIVKEEQGIERANSVTPREFGTLLASKGIPIPSIHQLTRLFEQVRYGSKPPGPLEEQSAIECLSAIRLHCEAGKRGMP